MCGGGKAPPPDPRIGQATLDQVALARDQWNDYVANDRPWQRAITNEALGIYRRGEDRADQMQGYQLGQMRRNDDRYWGVGVPFEDRLIKQVEDQDTDAYREAQVTRSLADTQKQVDNSRQQGIREMTRRGANPQSGAYAAMMNDGGRAQALAMATAANKTRLAAQQVGLSNKMQMYGGMKGLAGLGATSAQLATAAGGQAMGAGAGMTNAAYGSIGVTNQSASAAHSGMSAGISGYNGYYPNELAAAKLRADNDPGAYIAGTLVGYGTGWLTNKVLR